MAALLVSIAVMTVLMSVAMPVWRHEIRREKEAELVFRGEQYARAIALFQRKFPGAMPPNLDVLVQQRFLRKKYKDPMTEDGEFQLLYVGAQTGASQGGAGRQSGSRTTGASPSQGAQQSPGTQPGTAGAGARGGIMGVVSKSTDASIMLYKGRSHYNEWQFIYTAVSQQPGGVGLPGAAQPGQQLIDPRTGLPAPFGPGRGGRGGRGEMGGRGGRGPGVSNPFGLPTGPGPGTVPRPPGRGPGGLD
jgi:type II secretory pathway pseudopilin PulG